MSEKLIVNCDGCGKRFDASKYDDITTRHPHYNFILDKMIVGANNKIYELKEKIAHLEAEIKRLKKEADKE